MTGADEFVRLTVDRFHAALEEACERSLTDPLGRGVLVVRNGTDWRITLDPEVPWGNIHEYPDGRAS